MAGKKNEGGRVCPDEMAADSSTQEPGSGEPEPRTFIAWHARSEAAIVRLGVALLTARSIAPALKRFQYEQPQILLDYSAMFSDRLLDELEAGGLHAAIVQQVPGISQRQDIEWEPLRRAPLALIARPGTRFAPSKPISIDELSHQRLLVNPHGVGPGEFEWLMLTCREFGGCDPQVLESGALATSVPDAEGCPIESGAAVAVGAGSTARMAEPAGHVVVPIQPPPQYVVALAWRRGDQTPHVERLVDYLLRYRDEHDWL